MKKNTFLISVLLFSFVFCSATINSQPINPPSNDECDNAIALVCGETVVGETITATDSGANPAADVFYTFTGTGSPQLVTLSLCDGATDYDSFLRVYSDCTLSNEIASNDDSCELQSALSFLSDGISTYYIMVEGFSTNSGNFSLAIECTIPPPANNNCDNAIVLICDENVLGETITATDSGGNPAPDVFYSYTGSGITELITISLCDGGTDYDAWLRVFDDCTLNNQLASNDDFCGLQSELSFLSDGVSTYYIMVEGFQANVGNFSLHTTCQVFDPLPNNECDDAFVIECGDIINGDTSSSSSNGGNNSPDLFYTYTGSGQEEWVTLSTCSDNTDYDSRLLVYDNCGFEELLSENDNFCDTMAQLTFLSDGISSYQIIIEGSGSSSGNFELTISCETILGVEESSIDGFIFYPNPAKDIVNISATNSIQIVEIYNLLGKQVLKKEVESNNFELVVSNLQTGVYLMKVNTDTKLGIYKFIKE